MSTSINLSSVVAETTNEKKKSNPHTGLLGQSLNRVNLLCWLARDSLLNSPSFVFGNARIHSGRKALQPLGSQQKSRVSFYHSMALFHPHCRKDYAKGHCFLSSGRLGSLLRRQKFEVLADLIGSAMKSSRELPPCSQKAGFSCIIIPGGAGIWGTHLSVGLSEA